MKRPIATLLISATVLSMCNPQSAMALLTDDANATQETKVVADSKLVAQQDDSSKLRDAMEQPASDSAGGVTKTAQNSDADATPAAPAATPVEKTPPPPGANASLPARVGSTVVCSVLGYPIAMVRRTITQTKQGSRDLIGESKNPLLVGFTCAFSLPYAVAGGILEGGQYSVENSWRASKNDPFSKDAFSLGDMD